MLEGVLLRIIALHVSRRDDDATSNAEKSGPRSTANPVLTQSLDDGCLKPTDCVRTSGAQAQGRLRLAHASHAGRGADAALARGGEAGLLERGLQREHARGRRAVGALVGRPYGGEVELGLGGLGFGFGLRSGLGLGLGSGSGLRLRSGLGLGSGPGSVVSAQGSGSGSGSGSGLEVELCLGERGVPLAVHLQLLDFGGEVRAVLLVAA